MSINRKRKSSYDFPTRPTDETREMIANFFKSDSEVEVLQEREALEISLIDPITHVRLKTPGRTKNCKHLECFDLENYMVLNKAKKPKQKKKEKINLMKWTCPICQTPAKEKDNLLEIDKYFVTLLKEIRPPIDRVFINKDASWKVPDAPPVNEVVKIEPDDDGPTTSIESHDLNARQENAELKNQLNAQNSQIIQLQSVINDLKKSHQEENASQKSRILTLEQKNREFEAQAVKSLQQAIKSTAEKEDALAQIKDLTVRFNTLEEENIGLRDQQVRAMEKENQDLSPDRNGTICKSIIVEGEKYNCPADNATITVHVVGQHNSRVFYDRELNYILGEGSEHQLPEGVDRALRRVNKGEKCRVVLKGNQFTYGSKPPPEFGLEPNAEIAFTLFLKDFEKVKASWELLDNEKLEVAQGLKDRGTMFLNEGKYQLAIAKYNSVVLLLEHARPISTDAGETNMEDKFKQMLHAAFLNSALANLKMNETAECIKSCDRVLEKDPNHIKALYRKAQAYQQRKDFDEAIVLFTKVVEIEPENKAAAQQIIDCKAKKVELHNKERKRYAGIFDKLSKGEWWRR